MQHAQEGTTELWGTLYLIPAVNVAKGLFVGELSEVSP